jgi:outer membrane protein assembly factor BamB
MWHRLAVVASLVLATSSPLFAQAGRVYSRAIPPDKSVVERLNLKIEWTANIPVEGRRDALTQIQTIDDQIFVQTRTGLLIAGDALTGQLQWFVQLGNGDQANSYSVAANSQYVFAVHVTKLHAFHRYTGVVEFVTDLNSPPTTGLAADESGVYCVVGMRTGSTGGHRLAVYDLPRPIAIAEAPKKSSDPNKPPVKDPKAQNPVDNLLSRYSPQNMYRTTLPDVFDEPRNTRAVEEPVGGMSSSRSPSLSALPRITPPYTLANQYSTPSLNVLPSIRQPYHMRNDFQRDIQQTPSIGVIPPSIAASLALADLRPKNVEPPLRWEFGLSSRIIYPPFLTPTRVWVETDGRSVIALNKLDKKLEVNETLDDPISALPGRAGLMVYVPLGAGYIVAVEGTSGNLAGGANILWRTAVGGIGNRTPFVSDKYVYAQGDHSGIVCLDRAKGDIQWRSDDTADRIIAMNNEFLYVRDQEGKFLVFDAKRATDPDRKRTSALAGIDLSEFNVHVVNRASDRIFLAADNGLIVCMRDMNPKYARPVRTSPEPIINVAPKEGVTTVGKGGNPPKKDPVDPKKN